MTTADLYRQLADCAERIADLEQQNVALLQQVRELEATKVASEPRQWLTVKEAAEMIGHSPSFLHKDRMLSTPRLPYRQERESGKVFYSRVDLDNYSAGNMRGRKKSA